MEHIVTKFPVKFSYFSLQMPAGAQILSVGCAPNPTMWACIRKNSRLFEVRNFFMTVSDVEFDPSELSFIGTGVLSQENFIFHLFEKIKSDS